ncbi:MAG: NUDIX domain-containing protein [Flammeovirgaceae bacterium]|nr:NUDIX domain-containing protein [Flammeovirgaceae bacterium]
MKEYKIETDQEVDLNILRADKLPLETYEKSHQSLVQFCHDILVEYNGGILLIVRENFPVKDILWSLGGRVERGMSAESSAIKKVKEECNLDIFNIKELGFARTFFHTDPFGHGNGTDTVNVLYFAKAKGDLKLDDLHSQPVILQKEEYTEKFKKGLHPYMQDFLDKVIPLLESE